MSNIKNDDSSTHLIKIVSKNIIVVKKKEGVESGDGVCVVIEVNVRVVMVVVEGEWSEGRRQHHCCSFGFAVILLLHSILQCLDYGIDIHHNSHCK